jgi:hypothetical protein
VLFIYLGSTIFSLKPRFAPYREEGGNIKEGSQIMASYKITLKADLKRGSFYWVTTVEASDADEAVIAAEHLFMAEMENSADWSFSDSDIEEI